MGWFKGNSVQIYTVGVAYTSEYGILSVLSTTCSILLAYTGEGSIYFLKEEGALAREVTVLALLQTRGRGACSGEYGTYVFLVCRRLQGAQCCVLLWRCPCQSVGSRKIAEGWGDRLLFVRRRLIDIVVGCSRTATLPPQESEPAIALCKNQ